MNARATSIRLTKAEVEAMKRLETAVVPFETFTFAAFGDVLEAAVAELADELKLYNETMRAAAPEYGANVIRRTKYGLEANFDGDPPKDGKREMWVPSPSIGENWYSLDTFNKLGACILMDFDKRGIKSSKWYEAALLKKLLPTMLSEEALMDEVFSEAMSGFSVQAHMCTGSGHQELLVHIVSPAYNTNVLSAYRKLKAANAKDPMGDHQFEVCESIEAALIADEMRRRSTAEGHSTVHLNVDEIRLSLMLDLEERALGRQVVSGRAGLKRYRAGRDSVAKKFAAKKAAKKVTAVKSGKKIALPSPVADIGHNDSAAASRFAKRVKMVPAKKVTKGKSA